MMHKSLILGSAAAVAMVAALGHDVLMQPARAQPKRPEQDPSVKDWADKVGELTEVQAHVFRASRYSGMDREQAYAAALKIRPEATMDDLQASAKAQLVSSSPRYAAAEAKRARKSEKARQIAERA
jgi:hypothetical protein